MIGLGWPDGGKPKHRGGIKGKRQAVARRHRRYLVHFQQGKCWWCHRDIMDIRDILLAHKVQRRSRQFAILVSGEQILLATIDHITPVSRGGSIDDLANMVAACVDCNHHRNVEELRPDSQKKCVDCGRLTGRHRRCRPCRKLMSSIYLQNKRRA